MVVTGRDVDVVGAACEVSGAGAAGAALVTGRFGAVAAPEDETAGASGVGTACADSDARFTGRDAGAVAAFVGFEVEDVANPPGGSSGAGIGVPPAAKPTAGQANATMQTPAATESRLSRRDDVHLDTTSPPFRSLTVRRLTHTCQYAARVAAGRPAATRASVHYRFFFGIPPWIARVHAPPRWSSHEPWPATCVASEPWPDCSCMSA